MLDFGFSEILLTSAIALVVLGPERLPKVARQVGNWMGRARAMARQLTEQLEREVSAEELLKERPAVATATESHRILPQQPVTEAVVAPAPHEPAASTTPAASTAHAAMPEPAAPPNE